MSDAPDFNALPADITLFLHDHHVVGLATIWQGKPWAASCFYAFEASTASLIILSDEGTRHAMGMLASGVVAGTIAGQPTSIREIKGLQLVADVALLTGQAGDDVYATYCERHPVAKLKRSAVWRLTLQELKLTSNAYLFGTKLLWQRSGADDHRYPNL